MVPIIENSRLDHYNNIYQNLGRVFEEVIVITNSRLDWQDLLYDCRDIEQLYLIAREEELLEASKKVQGQGEGLKLPHQLKTQKINLEMITNKPDEFINFIDKVSLYTSNVIGIDTTPTIPDLRPLPPPLSTTDQAPTAPVHRTNNFQHFLPSKYNKLSSFSKDRPIYTYRIDRTSNKQPLANTNFINMKSLIAMYDLTIYNKFL